MVKNIKIFLSITVLILVFPSICLSAPFKSYTGLIHVPSAYVLGDQNLELVSSADLYQKYESSFVEMDGRITLGFERIELGLSILTENLYTLNFKLNFLTEDKNGFLPAMAWGVRDISTESRITSTGTDNPYNSEQNNSIFFVISKEFIPFDFLSFRVHLGMGANGFRADTPLFSEFGGIFAGFDIPFAKYFTFMAEFDGKHVNSGLKAAIQGMTIGVAVSSIDRLKNPTVTYGIAEGFRIGLGVSLRLDLTKPAPYGLWE